MDYEKWIRRACDTIGNNITVGTIFEVKQLFPGHEWEELSRGERSLFGRYFSNAVKDGRIPSIKKCEEGKNHHNRYIKKE